MIFRKNKNIALIRCESQLTSTYKIAFKYHQFTGYKKGSNVGYCKSFNTKQSIDRMHAFVSARKKFPIKNKAIDNYTSSLIKNSANADGIFLQKLKEILEKNYAEDNFDTNQLAQNIGLSRVQLFRKLKALTGVSASHFIRFYRLSKAKEKITGTSENISEIAFEVGFKDPAYFTRAFSKEFGIAPSSLRK